MKNLNQKVVIVTGASSGIGKACVTAFAGKGSSVMMAARNMDKLQSAMEEVKKNGNNIAICKADVANESDCKNLIDTTLQEFGRIDVLINNAGLSMRALFKDVDLSVLKYLMDVNFWGMVYCTKYAISQLLVNEGSVVGISSIAGFQGLPGRTGYSASKFAMEGFLAALRVENLKTSLHVMTVRPGYTTSNIRNTALNKEGNPQGDTPFDESKLMKPETVAQAIVDGVMNKKRSIVLSSQGKMTATLSKFFPGFIDRQVYNVISKEKDSPFQ
jgi:short-subunit dehydrogenase